MITDLIYHVTSEDLFMLSLKDCIDIIQVTLFHQGHPGIPGEMGPPGLQGIPVSLPLLLSVS